MQLRCNLDPTRLFLILITSQSLSQWLKSENIPGLTGIDTRALTKKLRTQGRMPAKIIFDEDIPFENPNAVNLVDQVSVKTPRTYGPQVNFILSSFF